MNDCAIVTVPCLITVAAGVLAPGHLGELTRYLRPPPPAPGCGCAPSWTPAPAPPAFQVSDRQMDALPLTRHDCTATGTIPSGRRATTRPAAPLTRSTSPAQPSPGLAWLCCPALTGLPGREWDALVAVLMTLHDEQRETSLDKRRGHRPRAGRPRHRPPSRPHTGRPAPGHRPPPAARPTPEQCVHQARHQLTQPAPPGPVTPPRFRPRRIGMAARREHQALSTCTSIMGCRTSG